MHVKNLYDLLSTGIDSEPVMFVHVCSEKVLMIPHPQSGQTVSQVFANRTEWMLMDRSRISFDGSECDKVCDGVV